MSAVGCPPDPSRCHRVTCKHHLGVHVREHDGRIQLWQVKRGSGKPGSVRADDDPADLAARLEQMPVACAVEAAEIDGVSLEELNRLTSWRVTKGEAAAAMSALRLEMERITGEGNTS